VFFIIVPPETNPARATHPIHSIVAMVKYEVLRNGHGRRCNWLNAGFGASVHRAKIGACHCDDLDLCSARFRQPPLAPSRYAAL